MKVLVTGASGLIGPALCDALLARGDEVVGLAATRRRPRAQPAGSSGTLGADPGTAAGGGLRGRRRRRQPGRRAIDQRWSDEAKRKIIETRRTGDPQPGRDDRRARAASRRCWSASRRSATTATAATRSSTSRRARRRELRLRGRASTGRRRRARSRPAGVRLVIVRTGQVLDPGGGMLAELLTPFKLGVGGPLAGGAQYLSWIHLDDEVGILLWALDNERSAASSTRPRRTRPPTRTSSKALGRALGRPAVLPSPGSSSTSNSAREFGKVLRGGQRVVPKRSAGARLRVQAPGAGRGAGGPALGRRRGARTGPSGIRATSARTRAGRRAASSLRVAERRAPCRSVACAGSSEADPADPGGFDDRAREAVARAGRFEVGDRGRVLADPAGVGAERWRDRLRPRLRGGETDEARPRARRRRLVPRQLPLRVRAERRADVDVHGRALRDAVLRAAAPPEQTGAGRDASTRHAPGALAKEDLGLGVERLAAPSSARRSPRSARPA